MVFGLIFTKKAVKIAAANAARATVQPRAGNGTFSSEAKEQAVPAQVPVFVAKAQADTIQETGRAVQNTGNVLDGAFSIIQKVDAMVEQRVSQKLEQMQPDALDAAESAFEDGEPNMLEVAMELMPQILPRIDAAIQAFSKPKAASATSGGVGYEWMGLHPIPVLPPTPPTPSLAAPSPPAAPSPVQDTVVTYMRQLAAADKKTIKLIAPALQGKLTEGLAKAGISREELLAACEKMPIVLRAKPTKQAQTADQDDYQLTLEEAAA